MNGNAEPVQAPAAFATNEAEGGATGRRPQRSRGFSILNEELLLELHAEMMGMEPPKARAPAKKPPLPPAKLPQNGPANGHAQLDKASEPSRDGSPPEQRPLKRQKSEDQKSERSKPSKGAAVSSGSDDDPFGPEEFTAWACGLNHLGLSEDEAGLLPEGADEEVYARVRNEVLVKWRADCSRRLTLEAALADYPDDEKPYALAAWKFLEALGYINYGVSVDTQKLVSHGTDHQGTVVVVGAGCAGLSAARHLRCKGYRVVIVEGRSRPGGRVCTARLSGPGGVSPVVADLGGSILTGIDGNPLAVVAKQLSLPLVHIRDPTPLYMPDGAEAGTRIDNLVETFYNQVLMHGCDSLRANPAEAERMSLQLALESLWRQHYPDLGIPDLSTSPSDPDAVAARQLFDWHLANLEFANACRLSDLSLVHWDQDDPNELPGPHCFVPGCNGRWLKHLCQGLAIFYDSPVLEVRYCSTGVAVHTPQRTFFADAVVVTTPLGVMKKGDIVFNPPLSDRKLGAISRLGFGNLNKVIMLFPHAFWGEENDMFGHVAEDGSERGEAFLFYSYAGISGGAQLTALVCGDAAAVHEARPGGVSAARVLAILRGIFEKKGVDVPPPLQVVVTKWGSDPMAYGAYSSMPVGTEGGQDYDTLGESVGGRLFFAGEATSRRFPATMHGAFFTGLWTAANVHATLSKAKPPVFCAPISPPVRAPSVKAQPLPPEVYEQIVQKKLMVTARLQMLFNDPLNPPDLEYGCIAVVFGPPNTLHAERTLLRVNFAAIRGNGRTPVKPLMYLVVRKDVALALADLPGDESRVAMLSVLPDGAISGRGELSPEAMSLMEAVLKARRFRRSTAVPVPRAGVQDAPALQPGRPPAI